MSFWYYIKHCTSIILSLLALHICISFLFLIPSLFIEPSLSHLQPKPSHLLVLGSSCTSKGPSPELQYRLDASYSLYQKLHVPIIVSGGTQKNRINEAKCMANYLIQKKIPKRHILLEKQATSTFENLLYSKHMYARPCIITSDYHFFRTLLLSKSLNIDASIYLTPHTSFIRVLREPLAFVKSLLFDITYFL